MPANHPKELHDLFSAAVNARDTEALVALYEPDGLAVHLDGETYTGEAALRRMMADLLAAVHRFDGVSRKVLVNGDLALTSASWTGEFRTPDGEVRQASGTTAELSRRQPDGSWRFVIDDPAFG